MILGFRCLMIEFKCLVSQIIALFTSAQLYKIQAVNQTKQIDDREMGHK